MKTFLAHLITDESIRVNIKKIFKFYGYKIAIHRPIRNGDVSNCGWSSSLYVTGLRICSSNTIKNTIEMTKKILKTKGKEECIKHVKIRKQEYSLPNNKEN